ncbi:hypothetical protein QJS10_CPB13g01431 [Acorus calamus]|uniref:Uncharacterized protein n=1 Tax=Acorus calamus TaxID=4465 RepID=A0AAV9DJ18_ACOCL|nr:hypothetical protein QJS10_CPB13g01431 [Acorus calamus]
MGHRSGGCSDGKKASTEHGTMSMQERHQVHAMPPVPGTMVPMEVEIPWLPLLATREEAFSSSILLMWSGKEEAYWPVVMEALRDKWRLLPPFEWWVLGPLVALARFPSLSVREVLQESSLIVNGGKILFRACDWGSGRVDKEAHRVVVQIKGLPLMWRADGVIQNVVGSFGHLVEDREDFMTGEFFPVLQASVWCEVGAVIPSEVVVNLDGWKKVVEIVRVENHGSHESGG